LERKRESARRGRVGACDGGSGPLLRIVVKGSGWLTQISLQVSVPLLATSGGTVRKNECRPALLGFVLRERQSPSSSETYIRQMRILHGTASKKETLTSNLPTHQATTSPPSAAATCSTPSSRTRGPRLLVRSRGGAAAANERISGESRMGTRKEEEEDAV
jgi:hypothetical protein